MKSLISLSFLGSILFGSITTTADEVSAKFNDTVSIAGFPAIGKWMLDKNSNIAHWLNKPYRGHTMNEPINIIIRMDVGSSEEAQHLLIKSTIQAGFPERKHHSVGYKAFIGDSNLAEQISSSKPGAFSDRSFFEDNNHGRIFGPVPFKDSDSKVYYFFTAAFSRERVTPIKNVENPELNSFHTYSSFNQARDRFADQMEQRAGATFKGYIRLYNDIHNVTGDHDGIAIFLDFKGS